jgi:hypothetical protein
MLSAALAAGVILMVAIGAETDEIEHQGKTLAEWIRQSKEARVESNRANALNNLRDYIRRSPRTPEVRRRPNEPIQALDELMSCFMSATGDKSRQVREVAYRGLVDAVGGNPALQKDAAKKLKSLIPNDINSGDRTTKRNVNVAREHAAKVDEAKTVVQLLAEIATDDEIKDFAKIASNRLGDTELRVISVRAIGQIGGQLAATALKEVQKAVRKGDPIEHEIERALDAADGLGSR